MLFKSLHLTKDGQVFAEAEGHPTDVIKAFHSVAQALLSSQGAWRITEVRGFVNNDDVLDSEMKWVLTAKSKV